MRIKLWEPALPKAKQDPYQWHRYFCWRPLFLKGHLIWLETVHRKAVDLGYKTYEGKNAWIWEYNLEGPELSDHEEPRVT